MTLYLTYDFPFLLFSLAAICVLVAGRESGKNCSNGGMITAIVLLSLGFILAGIITATSVYDNRAEFWYLAQAKPGIIDWSSSPVGIVLNNKDPAKPLQQKPEFGACTVVLKDFPQEPAKGEKQ